MRNESTTVLPEGEKVDEFDVQTVPSEQIEMKIGVMSFPFGQGTPFDVPNLSVLPNGD